MNYLLNYLEIIKSNGNWSRGYKSYNIECICIIVWGYAVYRHNIFIFISLAPLFYFWVVFLVFTLYFVCPANRAPLGNFNELCILAYTTAQGRQKWITIGQIQVYILPFLRHSPFTLNHQFIYYYTQVAIFIYRVL